MPAVHSPMRAICNRARATISAGGLALPGAIALKTPARDRPSRAPSAASSRRSRTWRRYRRGRRLRPSPAHLARTPPDLRCAPATLPIEGREGVPWRRRLRGRNAVSPSASALPPLHGEGGAQRRVGCARCGGGEGRGGAPRRELSIARPHPPALRGTSPAVRGKKQRRGAAVSSPVHGGSPPQRGGMGARRGKWGDSDTRYPCLSRRFLRGAASRRPPRPFAPDVREMLQRRVFSPAPPRVGLPGSRLRRAPDKENAASQSGG